MDKTAQYQQYIIQFLKEYAKDRPVNLPIEVEDQIITDTHHHHYQLFRVGWNWQLEQQEYIHSCVFHFDIKDHKIWVQQNNTEVLVGDKFVEMGVPKSDIVLGFQPPKWRQFTGFGIEG